MRTHTPTIGRKRAVDSTGKSESEICSPQDPIVYLSCRISGCNCQHHDREASWDLVAVAALKIRSRLWYRPTSWFRPPATRYPPPATWHTPPTKHCSPPTKHCSPHATCLTPPGAWRLQLNKSLDRACRSIFGRSGVFHGKLWPMENSEFVEALANRRL